MKTEVSTPIIIAVIVVVLIVIGYAGYRTFRSPKQDIGPRAQIEAMKHMKIGNK